MAASLASSGGEVAAGAGAGETTAETADEIETPSETDERTSHLFETTVAGNVIETGGIAKETVSGVEDAHHQYRGGHHPAEISETVTCR